MIDKRRPFRQCSNVSRLNLLKMKKKTFLKLKTNKVFSSYPQWFANFEKSGYDKNVRPLQGIRPLEIEVSIHVIRVHSISESTMVQVSLVF